jgi:hypothetical protein
MNPETTPERGRDAADLRQRELISALTGFNANAELAVAQRTRRTIRDKAESLREARKRRRRNNGFALLSALGFLMLLTPALWSGVDEIFAGEHLSDLPTMVTLGGLTLFSTIVAALVASWKNHQPLRDGRRNF